MAAHTHAHLCATENSFSFLPLSFLSLFLYFFSSFFSRRFPFVVSKSSRVTPIRRPALTEHRKNLGFPSAHNVQCFLCLSFRSKNFWHICHQLQQSLHAKYSSSFSFHFGILGVLWNRLYRCTIAIYCWTDGKLPLWNKLISVTLRRKGSDKKRSQSVFWVHRWCTVLSSIICSQCQTTATSEFLNCDFIYVPFVTIKILPLEDILSTNGSYLLSYVLFLFCIVYYTPQKVFNPLKALWSDMDMVFFTN